MKVLQINTTYNIGSTGRIMAGIDKILVDAGIDSYCAFGYGSQVDNHHYKIINTFDSKLHNIQSRLGDSQGLHSTFKTKRFIKYLDKVKPDIVHLHNLHGNYLDYQVLFEYLQKSSCKVVWTLHDCWPFTGHCAYFDMAGCTKWKSECTDCPQSNCYPPAIVDNSHNNFQLRKKLFTSLGDRLTMVPVSEWLAGLLKESIFANTKIVTIHNGINLSNFRHYDICADKPYILGVAAPWDKRKGLADFIMLREVLDFNIGITLVGLKPNQIATLPNGIIGIEKTNNVEELAKIYSAASVFVNTTYEDNYPTVNLEAIACGTPVITYRTGGSPESVKEGCGLTVSQGNIEELSKAIGNIISKKISSDELVLFAKAHFDESDCFRSYLKLYNSI